MLQRPAVVHADVNSANVVGYQLVPISNNWQTFTATFKNIGRENGKINLVDLLPVNPDGSEFTGKTAAGTIYLKFLSDGAMYGVTYAYQGNKAKSGLPNGWYLDDTYITEASGVEFNNGQGFALYNGTGQTMAMRVSGEVDLICHNAIIKGWSIMGNSTPCEIDLFDVLPFQETPGDFTGKTAAGTIYLKFLSEGAMYGETYAYQGNKTKSGLPNGWYLNDTYITKGKIKIPAGRAFAIYNGTGNVMMLQLPSPIPAN